MRQKTPRVHDPKHLQFLRGLNCLICGDNTSVEAAHIRMSDAKYNKVNPGVGARPDDRYCLPLCGNHHRAQHANGDERKYWDGLGMDPIKIALELYEVSGDHEKGCEIIEKAGKPVNVLIAG